MPLSRGRNVVQYLLRSSIKERDGKIYYIFLHFSAAKKLLYVLRTYMGDVYSRFMYDH